MRGYRDTGIQRWETRVTGVRGEGADMKGRSAEELN